MSAWWKEFRCWIMSRHEWGKTGTSRMMAQEMDTCLLCGKREAGPDGWH